MNDDKNRIEHIIEHIQRIQGLLMNVTEEQFYHSLILIEAVTYNFAIIGEAANNVSSELQNSHPDIPWRKIIAMCNFLIHDYVKSKPCYLWETAQKDFVPLLQKAEEIHGLLSH